MQACAVHGRSHPWGTGMGVGMASGMSGGVLGCLLVILAGPTARGSGAGGTSIKVSHKK